MTMTVEQKKYMEQLHSRYNDSKGGNARRLEVTGEWVLRGIVKANSRGGQADTVVKRGVTLEWKSGHGWIIEPQFDSREALERYLEKRSNPLVKASHVAYYPARATGSVDDVFDCLFYTANEFIKMMKELGRWHIKANRGKWGVTISPWISRGYKNTCSPSGEDKMRAEMVERGLTIWEFAEKMGVSLNNI